jgi:carbonic anhydrase
MRYSQQMTPFMKLTALALLLLGISPSCTWAGVEAACTSDNALKIINDGNQRFVSSQAKHPHQSHQYMTGLIKEQHPIVAVLTCSDSRIAPELIFDQGLGDIFDIRVAGNIVDDAVLGSLEYAVEHLHVPLIIVLGHQNCGAVVATMAHEHPHNHLNHIIHSLAPATQQAQGSLEKATKNNIEIVLRRLEHDATLKEKIKSGELKLVGGYYRLDTGQVELFSPPVNP